VEISGANILNYFSFLQTKKSNSENCKTLITNKLVNYSELLKIILRNSGRILVQNHLDFGVSPLSHVPSALPINKYAL